MNRPGFELTPGDNLLYVNSAINRKLLKCEVLIEQEVNNTEVQFANSPDFDARILDALKDALASFTSISKQALESEKVRADIKSILLGQAGLYEELRKKRD